MPVGTFPLQITPNSDITVRFDSQCPLNTASATGAKVTYIGSNHVRLWIDECHPTLTVDCTCPRCQLNIDSDGCSPLGDNPREVNVGDKVTVDFGSKCPLTEVTGNVRDLCFADYSATFEIRDCNSTIHAKCECPCTVSVESDVPTKSKYPQVVKIGD